MNPDADFKMVLLHDDLIAGVRGTSVLERLAGQMEEECDQLDTETWKFEWLRQPEARAQATSGIRAANLILISADGREELPEYIKRWFESVLARRPDREAAMVALLGQEPPPGRELPCLGEYLLGLAAKSGLDFFCNQGRRLACLEPPSDPATPTARLEKREDFAIGTDEGPWDSGRQGWGIND